MAELALNDDERHALASHLDGVGMAQLMRSETPADPSRDGRAPQLSSSGGSRPLATTRPAVKDTEQMADWKPDTSFEPRLEFVPAPRVHADLAAASALAATHEQSAASVIKIGFYERQRLLNAQAGAPEDHDQATQPLAVRGIASLAHDGDNLLDSGRIGRIAETLVSRRSTCMEAGHGRRRAASTGAVKQYLGHDPSSGSENATEHPPRAVAQ
ncbi:MAG: hypothetical protein QOD71_427 [Thermoleophilaceae bacterium]|nr:hypothetical protein [Thermoleophilaceae bacterium]